MRQVGMRPVVVHGGGPQISDLMARLGKVTEFRDGLRVTDAETIDIARMVLIGQVNPQLVAAINVHGPLAVGVSGEDAGLIKATARDERLGFVGDVESINPTILLGLLDDGFIPVVATVGTDAHRTGVQHQRRHRGRGDRRVARRREARLPHRHRGPASPGRRPGEPAAPDDARRARRAEGRRDHRRRDDPEDRQLRPGRAQRRAPGAHPRRPHPPRAAARDLHRRGDRHHDAEESCA